MRDLSHLFQDENSRNKQRETGQNKTRVLFVCTGNSVRSQMAESIMRNLAGNEVAAYSAGITPAGIHPLTKQVLAEIGISTEGQYSKHIDELADETFDYVILLCEVAALSCPDFPGDVEKLNWYIDDPIRIIGDEERKLMAFRITRNILKRKIQDFMKEKFPR